MLVAQRLLKRHRRYLAQERQLKTHHIHSIFYHLPPIRDLAVANGRLIFTGFALLAVGIAATVIAFGFLELRFILYGIRDHNPIF